MDIKELLDDDELDPKKLFNEKEYNTLIINREGFSKKENSIADLIEELLEPGLERARYEIIFDQLRQAQSTGMLVDAISKSERSSDKATIIAACWESGLDFSEHLQLFAELVFDKDFQVALEALSVVEGTEKLKPGKADEIISALSSRKGEHEELIYDLFKHLELLKNA